MTMELSRTKTKGLTPSVKLGEVPKARDIVASPSSTAGFTLLEILLSVALFGLLVTTLMGAYVYNAQSEVVSMQRERALFIANEGLEATRTIRDQSFDLLQPGTHGLSRASSTWQFSLPGPLDATENFNREITIKPIDTNSVKVVSTVKWGSFFNTTKTINLETLLTRWRSFPWQDPGQDSVIYLSRSQTVVGIKNIGNLTFLIRPVTITNFVVVDHSDIASPSVISQLSLPGKPAAFSIQGNYVYIASSSGTSELQIVDISNPSAPVLVGTYNASGTIGGISVAAVGNVVFLGRDVGLGPEFLSIDVSTPSSPVLLASIDPNIAITDINIKSTSNTYGYATSSDNASELLLLKISSPSIFSIGTPIDLPGTNDATSLDIENDILAVGRRGGSLALFSLLPDPSSPTPLSTFSISGGDVNDLDLDAGATKAFLAVGSATEGFQVVNIASLTTPSLLGVRNLNGASYAIHYDDALDRAFLGAAASAGNFLMLRPYP